MSFMGTLGEFALSSALVLQYLLGLLHVEVLRAGPGDLQEEVCPGALWLVYRIWALWQEGAFVLHCWG